MSDVAFRLRGAASDIETAIPFMDGNIPNLLQVVKKGLLLGADEIERLTAELAQVRKELGEALEKMGHLDNLHKDAEAKNNELLQKYDYILQRCSDFQVKNLQLTAQVAVMKNYLLEMADSASNSITAEDTDSDGLITTFVPEDSDFLYIEKSVITKGEEILSNLPAEAEKLLRLLASCEIEFIKHNASIYTGAPLKKVKCECEFCQAYRDLRGDK